MEYVYTLTNAMIEVLSIGNSDLETVWFWVKAGFYFRLALMAVDAFI